MTKSNESIFYGVTITVLVVVILLIILITFSELDRIYTGRTLREQYGRGQFQNFPTALLNYPITCTTPASLLSKLPVYPHPDASVFSNIEKVRSNWMRIRDEFIQNCSIGQDHIVKCIKNDSFFKGIADDKWKRLYIKWYSSPDPDAKRLMPWTTQLIESIPEIHLAMISILKAGGKISPHSGGFRGCLRYHLGLDTPQSDDCFIVVGGQKYSWRNGQDVIFDDTFYHYVQNNTDRDRIILFLDIERPQNTRRQQKQVQNLIKIFGPLTTRANSKQEKIEY